MNECRESIIRTYAGWTALSALRSGAPVKKRAVLYPLIDSVDFDDILSGSKEITSSEFDAWHEAAIGHLIKKNSRLNVGWSAKIVNVYLKTAAFVGDIGRPNLRQALHPPIDAGLWAGLRKRFKEDDVLSGICVVRRIKDINDYSTYVTIIEGCRRAADSIPCSLIELEQFWEGGPPQKVRVS